MLPKPLINLINILNNIICVVNLYLFVFWLPRRPGGHWVQVMTIMGYTAWKSGLPLIGSHVAA